MTISTDFDRILAFLQQPSAYPHHLLRVDIRQTHASLLAIVPPYVYEVKTDRPGFSGLPLAGGPLPNLP